jgi:hypothetical protein
VNDDRDVPFSPATIRTAAVAGVALLVLAGLVVFWVTPIVERSFDCRNTVTLLIPVMGSVAAVGGGAIVVVGSLRAFDARSWPSALVVFAGVALIVCAAAAIYLYTQTWGSAYCDPS